MKDKSEGIITQTMAASLLPKRRDDAHKANFGRVLVAAGSRQYPGAASLAIRAALRSGAGLVYGAIPESIYPPLASSIPEAIWLVQPDQEGSIATSAFELPAKFIESIDAFLIGPGLGQTKESRTFTFDFLEYLSTLVGDIPVVIDADALNLLSQLKVWHDTLPKHCVLTPHEMEFSRLTNLSLATIKANRQELAHTYARMWKQTLILKGPNTIVGSPEGDIRLLPFANSVLAHGGSGDVLAGLTVGLLAQGMDPFEAATLAVWLHAHAAELALAAVGHPAAVLPSDLINYFGKAMAELG